MSLDVKSIWCLKKEIERYTLNIFEIVTLDCDGGLFAILFSTKTEVSASSRMIKISSSPNQTSLDTPTASEELKNTRETDWVYLQDIGIDPEIVSIIYNDQNRTMNKQYKNKIAKNYVDPVVGCIALVKTYHIGTKSIYTGSENLCLWMYCQHPSCNRRLKATCNLSAVSKGIFKLFRSMHEQNHLHPLARHIRGVNRKEKAKILAECMPMEYRRRKTEEAADDLLEQKNLQDVVSDGVLNKIR